LLGAFGALGLSTMTMIPLRGHFIYYY